jgi:hypothetical protein
MGTELVKIDSAVPATAELLAAAGLTEEELAAQTGVMGMEGVRQEHIQIPRLAIAQPLSPQMIRSKPEYIEGLMVGQYFNTVTREVYGDVVTVVPVKYSMSRIKFTNNALDCRSKNGIDGGHYAETCKTCQFSKWGSGREGKGTDCKEYLNFLVVETSTLQPMVISFKSASLSAGKTWSTLILGRKIVLSNGDRKPAPAFMTTYSLKTVEKSSGSGVYYVPVVSVAGPSDTQLVTEGMALHKSFKGELDSDAQDE